MNILVANILVARRDPPDLFVAPQRFKRHLRLELRRAGAASSAALPHASVRAQPVSAPIDEPAGTARAVARGRIAIGMSCCRFRGHAVKFAWPVFRSPRD